MKLFAVVCGIASLMTAAINHRILVRFDAMYANLAEEPLPAVTRALLWKGGALPTGLLLASSVIVLVGLLRKSNRWMLAGGIAALVFMLGAATIVPAALMTPVGRMIQKVEHARGLRRVGMSRRLRMEPPPMGRRYEHAAPGDLVHLDTKKLGRIRGLGHRVTGQRTHRTRGIGWEFLHIAIDDHSRVARGPAAMDTWLDLFHRQWIVGGIMRAHGADATGGSFACLTHVAAFIACLTSPIQRTRSRRTFRQNRSTITMASITRPMSRNSTNCSPATSGLRLP